MKALIVTRHLAAIKFCRQYVMDNFLGDVEVSETAQATGQENTDIIIGILPVHLLAQYANRGIKTYSLTLPQIAFGDRGQELDAAQMKAAGARIEKVKIDIIATERVIYAPRSVVSFSIEHESSMDPVSGGHIPSHGDVLASVDMPALREFVSKFGYNTISSIEDIGEDWPEETPWIRVEVPECGSFAAFNQLAMEQDDICPRCGRRINPVARMLGVISQSEDDCQCPF